MNTYVYVYAYCFPSEILYIPLHLAGTPLGSYTLSMIYQELNSKGRKTKIYACLLLLISDHLPSQLWRQKS